MKVDMAANKSEECVMFYVTDQLFGVATRA